MIMADFFQNPSKLTPKLDRVLPPIDIPPSIKQFIPSDKSNKKTILIIAGAVIVVVLIIIIAFLFLKSQPEITPPVKPTPFPPTKPTTPYTPLSTPYLPLPTVTPFVANICGNGVIDEKESCDGSNFGGRTCTSEVSSNYEGSLSCTSTCKLDTTNCRLKRIVSIKSSSLPPLTQTSATSTPAPNAVKVTDSVKFSNSVKIT